MTDKEFISEPKKKTNKKNYEELISEKKHVLILFWRRKKKEISFSYLMMGVFQHCYILFIARGTLSCRLPLQGALRSCISFSLLMDDESAQCLGFPISTLICFWSFWMGGRWGGDTCHSFKYFFLCISSYRPVRFSHLQRVKHCIPSFGVFSLLKFKRMSSPMV